MKSDSGAAGLVAKGSTARARGWLRHGNPPGDFFTAPRCGRRPAIRRPASVRRSEESDAVASQDAARVEALAHGRPVGASSRAERDAVLLTTREAEAGINLQERADARDVQRRIREMNALFCRP